MLAIVRWLSLYPGGTSWAQPEECFRIPQEELKEDVAGERDV